MGEDEKGGRAFMVMRNKGLGVLCEVATQNRCLSWLEKKSVKKKETMNDEEYENMEQEDNTSNHQLRLQFTIN